MNFEFATATRVVFGPGSIRDLVGLAAAWPDDVLLFAPPGLSAAGCVEEALRAAGRAVARMDVTGEPTLDLVRRGASAARALGEGPVVGVGGGSAVDAAKAVAMLAANGGDPLDYAEVIGAGRPVTKPSRPLIAVPTTAGTGAEVTRNAVIASPEHRFKVSLRSPHMLPRLAIVDPDLAKDAPPAVVAATGMDALSQLVEPFVSCRANPLVDALCRDGLARAARALERVAAEGADAATREDLALAALYSGMALANAGLGAVHGFAAPIGGMFPAPHGAVCAALLGPVMAANIRALAARAPDHPARARYDEAARILTGNASASAEDGARWADELAWRLGIPRLAAWGVTLADTDELVARAAAASSMKGNPIPLEPGELRAILAEATG